MIGEEQIRKQEEKAREAFRWLMLARVTLLDATQAAPFREGDLVAVRSWLDEVSGELAAAIAWRTTELEKEAS